MPVQEIKLKAASDAPSKSGLENVPPDQLERAMKAAMARNDTDLDLTEEEQNKFTKAFQDKEFRKMMAEYVDEISDPKHRAEQDAYIREMEAKGETPKDKRVIHPAAGFVVKTKKEDGAKLFINVVSSTEVEQPTSTTVNGGSQWQLPHLLGPPRMERDKKDNSVGAFDCCFHPLALQHAESARPFRDLLVSTAIDAVERSYKNQNQPTKLSRTYHVLLGVKYKTGPPQALMVASRVESNFAALLGIRHSPHAIDATPARWRGGVGLVPLDSVITAALSPRNDFVENYRVHPTHG
jgi:dynein assembly factor 2